jgi:predicted DNA-binding transcriptional regulator YafY
LPLHHSQKEVEPCVFEWFVAPTLDFIQQLRTYGSELEILLPQSLREQFKAELEKQLALYK